MNNGSGGFDRSFLSATLRIPITMHSDLQDFDWDATPAHKLTWTQSFLV
ncbi:hypothetical protein OAN307_c11010 [Octadecabacter antarcticus 307]|uniref:Uncharacterized protein n=1 Tax=Octadecabacter antarcticus 307 TaxID=391626 RepID=M9R900_9RHOB|nr:hypothetical protein OAN307_c11010 [Octadecabacter antarcticus 307]